MDPYTGIDARNPVDDSRQIPVDMQPWRKEVRDYGDAICPLFYQNIDGFLKVRHTQFQKSRFDKFITALARKRRRHHAHGLISGFDTRSVREYHQSRFHPPLYLHRLVLFSHQMTSAKVLRSF